MSGSKAPLACVWHKEQFYTAGSVPWNSVGGLANGKPALGFHAVKSERIYHADSRNQSCIRNLYKHTFGATNQLAIALYVRSALCIMANQMYMVLQQSSAKPSWCVV